MIFAELSFFFDFKNVNMPISAILISLLIERLYEFNFNRIIDEKLHTSYLPRMWPIMIANLTYFLVTEYNMQAVVPNVTEVSVHDEF